MAARAVDQVDWSMIRKKHALGLDPMGEHRFSEKIMLNQRA
jgi:hypothetical protein